VIVEEAGVGSSSVKAYVEGTHSAGARSHSGRDITRARKALEWSHYVRGKAVVIGIGGNSDTIETTFWHLEAVGTICSATLILLASGKPIRRN